MSLNPDSKLERERLLGEVRAEIERDRLSGRRIDSADLIRRYPDLNPELADLLSANPSGETLWVDRSSIAAISTGATVASDPAAPRLAGDAGHGMTAGFIIGEEATEVDYPTVATGFSQGQGPTLPFFGGVDDPSAATVEATVRESKPASQNGSRPLAPGQRIRYIGDYEILSILGKGGMGIVYKARQVSLNRNVALKLIKNIEFASPEQLSRFQLEAEAVATLDHPGIIPVYEVGSFEDQRYFSMKMIEGDGLEKRLAHLSKHPRDAAKIVAAVADAIHHAHQRGILHRDLKPANILIDSDGQPHVTDFGLAKKIEGDDGLTVTGAIMGTPAYMAPEQALGRTKQITTTTDVYGIGAILYAVLTNHAPFGGDSVLETLEHVRQDLPEAPTRRNVQLPRDLEVICLKCLEKEPKRRYQSAAEVSADLNRWLNHEPILARPVSTATRVLLWCQRNPALATLAASLVLATTLGLAGVTYQWREALYQRSLAVESRDLAMREAKAARAAEVVAKTARAQAEFEEKAARAAEEVAKTARKQAERNAILASTQAIQSMGAVQDLISQVRDNLREPNLYELKTKLLDSALKRIDGVADGYDKSTSKEATTIVAMSQLVGVYKELGQTEKAFELLEKVVALCRERIIIKERSDGSRRNLALNLRELGVLAQEYRRDLKEALGHYEESLAIWEDVQADPRAPQEGDLLTPRSLVLANLAESNNVIGVFNFRVGDIAKAREYYQKATNLYRKLVNEEPELPTLDYTRAYSTSLATLAEVAFRTGDAAAATESYNLAVDRREENAKKLPKASQLQVDLGGIYFLRGWFWLRTGKLDLAHEDLKRSLKLREELASSDPRNVVKQRDLSVVLYMIGILNDREKKQEAAAESFKAALAVRRKLVEISPENDSRQLELMVALARLGEVNDAAKIADRIAAGPNVDNEMRYDLARTYAMCSKASEGEKAEAFALKSVDTIRTAIREGYKDRISINVEADLDSIRDRGDFKTLMTDLPIPK